MAGTGIQEILSTAFGGVLKIWPGKKYPQNVRAFRMLVEELRRPIFAKHHRECMEDLQQALDVIATQSRSSKLWVDCLIIAQSLSALDINFERAVEGSILTAGKRLSLKI